jgi:multiple sugar transport system permease protein
MRLRAWRTAAYVFMIVACLAWLVPVLFALYVSFRPYAETSQYGYVSLPHHLTLQNYINAWTQSDMLRFLGNSVLITVPAVIVTLLLASMVAFVVTRVSSKVSLAQPY